MKLIVKLFNWLLINSNFSFDFIIKHVIRTEKSLILTSKSSAAYLTLDGSITKNTELRLSLTNSVHDWNCD